MTLNSGGRFSRIGNGLLHYLLTYKKLALSLPQANQTKKTFWSPPVTCSRQEYQTDYDIIIPHVGVGVECEWVTKCVWALYIALLPIGIWHFVLHILLEYGSHALLKRVCRGEWGAGKRKIDIKGPPRFKGLKCVCVRKRDIERKRTIPNEKWQTCLVADSYTVHLNPKLLRFWPGASRDLSLSLFYSSYNCNSFPLATLYIIYTWERKRQRSYQLR